MVDSSDQGRSSYSKAWLYRSNLRDIVVIVSCVSALFFHVNYMHITIGAVLLVFGIGLHLLTKGTLIRNVVLCNTGIYSTIRHPYYLANYLVDTAFCILSGNLVLLILYPFLFFWAYGPTIDNEEGFLMAAHPEEFQKHTAEVPQVFPGPTSNRSVRAILSSFSPIRISKKEVARILRFLGVAVWIVALRFLPVGNVWTTSSFSSFVFPTTVMLLTGGGLVLYLTGVFILIPAKRL